MHVNVSVALNLFAVIVLVSCVALHFKKLVAEKAIPYIGWICISVAVMLLSDIAYLATCLEANKKLAFVAEQIYYAFNTFNLFSWGVYVGTVIYGKRVKSSHIFKYCVFTVVVNTLIVIVNFAVNIMYRIGDDGVVAISGIIYYVYAILNWIIAFMSLILILSNKDRFNDGSFVYIIMFMVPSVIAELLIIYIPQVSFVCLYTVSIIMLLNAFQKYKEYREIDRIIDEALEKGEFKVVYQPVYDLNSSRFATCEALLRLPSKDNVSYGPEEICSAAEESGKISEIGSFVFEDVCSFISSPEFHTLGIKRVCINMSMKQMKDPGLYNSIMSIVTQYGVNPTEICLELTETVVSEDTEMIMKNMSRLHSEGFIFALDDYGSGYSNLYRIATFPFSILKIDRTIVQNDRGKKSNIIISNTIKMAKQLDMCVVAEGVETESQLEDVKEFGVDFIQGWYYSKALPKKRLIEFLKKKLKA